MERRRYARLFSKAAGVMVLGSILAGCGDGSGGNGSSTNASAASNSSGGGAPTPSAGGSTANNSSGSTTGGFQTSSPSGTGATGTGSGGTGSVTENRVPQISGSPARQVQANQAYAFTPVATDADGDPLSFRITNKPQWLSFDSTIGKLSGTPTDADVGLYSTIIISVSDGKTWRSLPAFQIYVVSTGTRAVTLDWTAPTENEDGTPLTDLAGFHIRYGQQPGQYSQVLNLNNPGLTTFVVTDLVPSTYYFVVSAYNSKGVESNYSNEVAASLN